MVEDKQLKPEDTLEDARAKAALDNKPEEVKPASTPKTPPADVPEWAKAIIDKQAILEAENEALKELAGKNALASLEASKKDNTLKRAHFKMMEVEVEKKDEEGNVIKTLVKKIITGWGRLDDSKFVVDLKDPHKENLFMNVKCLDGSEGRVEYIRFIRCTDLVYADLTNYNSLKFDPTRDYTVKFPNDPDVEGLVGQEVKINFKFINA